MKINKYDGVFIYWDYAMDAMFANTNRFFFDFSGQLSFQGEW